MNAKHSGRDADLKWKVLSSKLLSDNPFTPLREELCLTPQGKKVTYYTTGGSRDSVLTLPFTKEGEMVLVRLYRHGAGRVFIEPPAGIREKRERPEATSRRELLEETGYRPSKLVKLGEGFYDPSRSTGKGFNYAAFGCTKVAGQDLDYSEEIQVLTMRPGVFLRKLLADRFSSIRVAGAMLSAKARFPHLFDS